jgi:hypothetical protein
MPEHKTKSQLNDALCAPYEPLRPPEYKRNELGQFSRPGNTLGKTQKKTGLIKKGIPSGKVQLFQPGHDRPGPGRPKGSQSKVSVALKEAILRAGEIAGGKEGLTGYLVMLARSNSSAYAGLLSKILPSVLAADADSHGGNVEIRFVRHIVYPSGRIESDDRPKQLPPPDAHALPRPTDPTDDTNEGTV